MADISGEPGRFICIYDVDQMKLFRRTTNQLKDVSAFQEKLRQINARVEGNLAPQFLKIMHDATDDLKASGIGKRILTKGMLYPAFNLINQNNEPFDSKTLLKQGPLAITFYRGFWCPYCNADLSNLMKYKNQLEEAGAIMLAISPEKPEYSQKIIDTQNLDFDILWDQGNQLAAKFGLRFTLQDDLKELYRDKFHINLKKYHGDDDWALPVPSRFVIDQDGIIQYAEFDEDYTRRPDPEDMIEAITNLK